jgi:hypothetical protein
VVTETPLQFLALQLVMVAAVVVETLVMKLDKVAVAVAVLVTMLVV